MIWLFLGGGVYSVILLTLGFLAGWNIKARLKMEQKSTLPQTQTGKSIQPGALGKQGATSGALKSITPLERSLEESQEIREKIEHLLS